MKSRWLNQPAVADLAGVSLRTFQRWIQRGLCPPYVRTPGGFYRFDRGDVVAWLAAMRVDPENTGEEGTL